jgi:hypothetical protein
MSQTKLQELFYNDLILAKLYLIVEEIQQSTLKTINQLSIAFQQKIDSSDGIRAGKIKMLSAVAGEARENVSKSFNINSFASYEDFKQVSSSLLSSLKFYFSMEDLAFTIASEIPALEILYQKYVSENEQDETNSPANNNTTTKTQETEENPEINVFLDPKTRLNLSKNILKVLNGQTQSSKDQETVKLNTVALETVGNIPELFSSDNKTRFSKEILKLGKTEYQNLAMVLSSFIPIIKTIRMTIGKENVESIKKDLLKEPKND